LCQSRNIWPERRARQAIHARHTFVGRQQAVAEGAKTLIGGARDPAGQLFYKPTVIVDVTADMDIVREEIFGPVAPASGRSMHSPGSYGPAGSDANGSMET
jgi:Aldehyde dehydrogenase family